MKNLFVIVINNHDMWGEKEKIPLITYQNREKENSHPKYALLHKRGEHREKKSRVLVGQSSL
jgi:hypothetical protein